MTNGIAILGMHRGGTSAIARIMHGLGAFMGDNLLPPSQFNQRGYFEDSDIIALHTDMLGGNWASPVMNRTYRYVARYEKLMAQFQEHDFWAIKDPRLCYCLPILRKVVPTIKVITVYRDPMNAARSLAEREGMDIGFALPIAIMYFNKMTENTVGKDNVLPIRYLDAVTDREQTVKLIAGFAGVPVTVAALEAAELPLAHWEIEDCTRIWQKVL